MGWTSTADPLEYVARASLAFHTKEDAISFAKKHGWQFEVDEPHERKTKRTVYNNAYSDNFSTKRKGVPDMSNLRGLQK
jgi:NADH dehydrogenase (ubiquinone) Fe-S protein 4